MREVIQDVAPDFYPELERSVFQTMLARCVAEKIVQREIVEVSDVAATVGEAVARGIMVHVEMLRHPWDWQG
jgi:hypothetical protein